MRLTPIVNTPLNNIWLLKHFLVKSLLLIWSTVVSLWVTDVFSMCSTISLKIRACLPHHPDATVTVGGKGVRRRLMEEFLTDSVLDPSIKLIFCLFGRQSSDLNKATPPEQPKKGTNLECDRKESGRLHQSHVLHHGQSAQLCTPQLPGANKLCLKNAFGFKMLHCNRRGSKCLIFTQYVKEPFLLYLKPQENPSSSLLIETLKRHLWLCELPFSAAANGHVSNELLKVYLWCIDSFLNAISHNQIFLFFNCGVWHPRQPKTNQLNLVCVWDELLIF